MNQTNHGGENFSVTTGENNTNFFGGTHYHGRRSATGIPHNLPYSGVTAFVGRQDDLERLHQQLQPGNTVAISAVSGMGGIGKTELALQYAYQHLALRTYPGGICWLKAREELGIQIIAFAQSTLDVSPPEDMEFAAKVAYCWRHWTEGTVLVVLDDVQAYQDIQPLLPPAEPRFRIVLTTRLTLRSPVQNFEIKVLTEAAALDLLRSLVKDRRIDQQIDEARQICEWLGYLPLGLELVGRYLERKPDLSLATLWQRLQDKRLDAKALKAAAPEMTAMLGVAAAFELSWDVLDEAAQQLAGVLSLFALAEIPWVLVEQCLPAVDSEELEDLRDEQLVGWHLLQQTGNGMVQLHQLLREFFAAKRSQMPADAALKQTFCRVMAALADQMPFFSTQSQIKQFTPAIPHLKEAATTLHPWLTDGDVIKPSSRIAQFYEAQAAYKDTLLWYQHCLEIAEIRLGAKHPAVATSLNNLATLYQSQGRYSEAEPLYVRSLSIMEHLLGAVHPVVATSLNNLALLYKSQGRYSEAEPLYVRSLSIREQQLGANYPDVAQSLNNLALLYYAQGRYSEAEPLYVRSLSIREQQLGANHPAVAQSLNNLAMLYGAQGRYSEAEPLYGRSLSIYEQQLGADHPDVASSLNNLAALYHSQGRYDEAEPLYLNALGILFNRLDHDHPNTKAGWNNFVTFLAQVIQAEQTAQLSKHPVTQDLLRQLQTENTDA